ncbi:hypothetical protein BC940DRAFT_305836 [Gongronella butleri]|nr:hypothetical protein BC940DRAFT_305836 [Gongronella butleri]
MGYHKGWWDYATWSFFFSLSFSFHINLLSPLAHPPFCEEEHFYFIFSLTLYETSSPSTRVDEHLTSVSAQRLLSATSLGDR